MEKHLFIIKEQVVVDISTITFYISDDCVSIFVSTSLFCCGYYTIFYSVSLPDITFRLQGYDAMKGADAYLNRSEKRCFTKPLEIACMQCDLSTFRTQKIILIILYCIVEF